MEQNYSQLDTERSDPETADIDRCSALEIVTLLNAQDKTVAFAVEQVLPQIAEAVTAIEKSFQAGGRLIYVGAGTSGRLGVLDASECPPTYGTSPQQVQAYIAGGDPALRSAAEGCEDDAEAGARLIRELQVNSRDVVVGISASGSAAYVIAAVEQARAQGAVTAGLATNPGSLLEQSCQIPIVPQVGPEPIAGSTRMKSGTAQKMVLNMLTTAAMIRTGKVYGNQMVDLRASNKKLEARALRIVMQVSGMPEQVCREALLQANMHAKTAICMLKTGMTCAQAQLCLQQAEGRLRDALERYGARTKEPSQVES